MKGVEEQYREAIGGWSGRRRVERAEELFAEVQEMLTRRIELQPIQTARRSQRIALVA